MAGASGPVPLRPPHTEAERRSTRGVELVAQAATSKCASRAIQSGTAARLERLRKP
jgi:hypothetical protein